VEDSGIIDLFFQRSETAIENTSKKYGSYLSSIAYRILNSLEDSEEVVDDTYLLAWNAIPPTRPKVLKHFLSRITRNLSLDRLQYYAAEKRNAETVAILEELEACLPDPRGSAESAIEESELTIILNRFLGELEPLTCCVFLSRYYYAHTVKEVAAQFDLSEGKTEYLLAKARSALRARLIEEGITV
jgi:RNA polymerase sigma-70 factor (ECF subfamily)